MVRKKNSLAIRWRVRSGCKSESDSIDTYSITLAAENIQCSSNDDSWTNDEGLSLVKHVFIFTDGACRGNPGPGGWGVVMRYSEHEKTFSGAQIETTNN